MRVYVVRKWPLRGRSRFVCWNITRVSLWLLYNVHFVQSMQRTCLRDLAWHRGTDHCSSDEYRCTHVDACVCGKNLNIVSMCAVSPVVHTSNICTCQTKKKKLFSFPVAVNSSITVGPLVFLLWMFVIRENIVKRPVFADVNYSYVSIFVYNFKEVQLTKKLWTNGHIVNVLPYTFIYIYIYIYIYIGCFRRNSIYFKTW